MMVDFKLCRNMRKMFYQSVTQATQFVFSKCERTLHELNIYTSENVIIPRVPVKDCTNWTCLKPLEEEMEFINKRPPVKSFVTGRFIYYSTKPALAQTTDQKTKSPRGIDFPALVGWWLIMRLFCFRAEPGQFSFISRWRPYTLKQSHTGLQ